MDMGKVEMLIQCCRDPDLSRLNPSMIAVADLGEVRRFGRVLEIEREIFEEVGLIPFYRKVVVCFSIFHQVSRELTLREQCIRRDGSAFNLKGIEQGRRRLDLIGLFFFITAFYGQCPHFFWA